MRLNTNIFAMNSIRNLNFTGLRQAKAIERLSSGKKINRAYDDASGHGIAEKMRLQASGLQIASKNTLDGISLIQAADGTLNEINSMIQRMRELAVKSASDANQEEDRITIQHEIDYLTSEVNRMGNSAEFNKIKLFNKTDRVGFEKTETGYKSSMKIPVQTGANASQLVDLDLEEITAKTLAIAGDRGSNVKDVINPTTIVPGAKYSDKTALTDVSLHNSDDLELSRGIKEYALDVTSYKTATNAIKVYDNAIGKLSEIRARLGAAENRFEHTILNLDSAAESLTGAMSRIEDSDLAEEFSEFTKYNILQQAGNSMLAQANQLPQMILKLLDA